MGISPTSTISTEPVPYFPSGALGSSADISLLSAAPNALSGIKAKIKGLLKGKKKDNATETTKPTETATNGATPAETTTASEPAPVAARKSRRATP